MGGQKNIKHPHLYMTLSIPYLDSKLKQLEEFGFARSEALAALKLSEEDLKNTKGRTDAARVEEMYRVAAESLNDPRIGIRVGYKFRVHDYKKTGSIYSHCENLAQVLQLNSLYQCLTIDVGQPEYLIEEGRHFYLYNRYEEAKHMHHVMGAVFGAWATAFRWLSWAAGHELKEAHLMPRAPEDISFYQEVVQCPIVFGMPRNHVEFHPESITKPLITRNPEKLAQSISILDRLLDRGNESENFLTAISASTQAAMAEGQVSLSIVASRMHMSERQFRNRMTGLELSFRDLLEEERKRRFRQLHAKGESFAAIAQALAYNDQAAFNRAFKRWYDMSPSEYTARGSEYI
jgi:AraC-like DNA-binding protein